MFKSFRVAGFAAAALLCTANSAAAEEIKASPIVQAAVVAPVSPVVTSTPAVNADQAVIALPAAPSADNALTVGRVRPDRAIVATPAPAIGVTGAATPRRSLDDLVAEHAEAAIVDEQFECLASAVYFESRGEPLDGQLAVAEVILNRVRSGRFRESICGVVTQPSQFSFVRRGVIPEANRASAAWHRAVAIAHIALNDLHDVTGDDSLFFHATYVNPRWGRPRIARIGNHIFYR